MTVSTNPDVGQHTHSLALSAGQMERLKLDDGEEVEVITSDAIGHEHTLVIYYDDDGEHKWKIKTCDGEPKCWDGHEMYVNEIHHADAK